MTIDRIQIGLSMRVGCMSRMRVPVVVLWLLLRLLLLHRRLISCSQVHEFGRMLRLWLPDHVWRLRVQLERLFVLVEASASARLHTRRQTNQTRNEGPARSHVTDRVR